MFTKHTVGCSTFCRAVTTTDHQKEPLSSNRSGLGSHPRSSHREKRQHSVVVNKVRQRFLPTCLRLLSLLFLLLLLLLNFAFNDVHQVVQVAYGRLQGVLVVRIVLAHVTVIDPPDGDANCGPQDVVQGLPCQFFMWAERRVRVPEAVNVEQRAEEAGILRAQRVDVGTEVRDGKIFEEF